VAKIDQLSQTIRYIKVTHDDNGRPTDIQIKESFIGFYKCKSQTAADMSEQIVQILQAKGIFLEQCRGQGYDGASSMSGVYSGVQKRILDGQPLAVYIHCASHNLNLVMNDAVSTARDIEAFFSLLQELYKFFGHSIRRWDLLSSITGESTITLKKLNPTRWAGRLTTLMGIKFRYCDIQKALSCLVLNHNSRLERDEATHLRAATQTFEFVDLSNAFPVQLVMFQTSFKSQIAKLTTVQQMTHLLIVDYAAVASGFTDVVTAMLLFLTLPVTVASAERSFSKLRLIKSYLRSTMGQDRLRGLALLSIEAKAAELLETGKLIDDFAHAKARRKTF
jgi:hypothetical protein